MTTPKTEYDPLRPGFYDDPFPVYKWMRDEAPVYYSERWNWYALSRFDDIREVIRDHETYLSYEGMDIDDTAGGQLGNGSLPNMDPPRHGELRKIIQPWFLPRKINENEDEVRAVVRGLIDKWRDRGSVDIAQELAWPIPFDVFFGLMGYPAASGAERERLWDWVHRLKHRIPNTPHLTEGAKEATEAIKGYFIDMLNRRREDPQDDLLSHIVLSEIDGVPFCDEHIEPASEVLGLLMVLFLGGVESTAGLVGSAFKLLAENPDQRALVQADPSLIRAAVEETLRLYAPLQLTARTTAREVTLHGVTIPAKSRMVLVIGAGNRDERQFENPDKFDVTRGTPRNLGFGDGIHVCPGAPLARQETKIALEEALPILGDYSIAAEPVFYPSTPNMYVWQNLHLEFDAG